MVKRYKAARTMVFATLITLILLQLAVLDTSTADKICPKLREVVDRGETATVMVTFSKDLAESIKKAKEQPGARSLQMSNIITELKKATEESQKDVMTMLSAKPRSVDTNIPQYTSYWLSNSILIENASKEEIEKIAQDSQVSGIHMPQIIEVPDKATNRIGPQISSENRVEAQGNDPDRDLYPPWNYTWPPHQFWASIQIQVKQAWAELGGKKGEGVVVANVDTGVHLNHATLKNSYRGEYGWFDPVTNATEPFDDAGHGTMSMSLITGGTLLDGKTYLGVAPGASWMACKGCGIYGCEPPRLMDCFQWIACPTLPDGTGEDCSKSPDVLNLSLGGIDNETELIKAVDNLVAMGIIVVAGISNSGHECETAFMPATAENVIGVGASDYQNNVAFYSGRGPTRDKRVKPDLVAPGDVVWVAYNETEGDNGTDAITWNSGSSFACPYVTGVVALLKVRNPDLTWQEAKKLLIENVDGEVGTDAFKMNETMGQQCGGTGVDTVPNNLSGWGRLNAFKTLKAQTALLAG